MSGIGHAITSTTYSWTSMVVLLDRGAGKNCKREDIEKVMMKFFDRQLTYTERQGWRHLWDFGQIDEMIRERCHLALVKAFPGIDVCWYGKQVEISIKAAACLGGFVQ